MNNTWISQGLRFLLYLCIQVFILKEIEMGESGNSYIELIIYPAVLLFIPFNLPQFFLLVMAFLSGVTVDLFYHSPGVHAGACLWMVAFRPLVLKWLEPKNGYAVDQKPSMSLLGVIWFGQYMGILLFIFFLSYFSLKIFTFVYIQEILLKTILSFCVSLVMVFLIHILFSRQS